MENKNEHTDNVNKTRGKVYVSGPITERDRTEMLNAFNDIRYFLEIMGYEVVLPIENHLPNDAPHTRHMRSDIGLLIGCDYIYLMEGWMNSNGCVGEMLVARVAGIKVLHNEEAKNYPECDVSIKIEFQTEPGVLAKELGVKSVTIEEVSSTEDTE